eukprot:549493-Pyramimonas_sp.AAC.1
MLLSCWLGPVTLPFVAVWARPCNQREKRTCRAARRCRRPASGAVCGGGFFHRRAYLSPGMVTSSVLLAEIETGLLLPGVAKNSERACSFDFGAQGHFPEQEM